MKSNRKTFVFLLFAISAAIFIFRSAADQTPFSLRLLATLDPSLVTTTPTRTQTVRDFCTVGTSNLISQKDKQENQQYFALLKTYFKNDISSLIGSALNGNMTDVINKLKDQSTTLGIYIAPFVIGLILSLTLWAFLCCCCTCTTCCPSKCCQHDENTLYTKCELYWPAIVLLVLLAVVIGASIPGITQASKISDGINKMQCGVGLLLDNLLNGNITSDQTSFFSGTNTLVALLNQLSTSLTNINNNFTSVSTSVTNVKNRANTVKGNIETLGLGAANTSFSLSYTNPTPGTAYSATSIFGSVLGNPTIANTLSSGLYSVINTLHTEMGNIEGSINTFNTATGNGDVNNQITATINQFNPINTQINDVDNSILNIFKTATPILNYLRLGVLVFFAVSITLGVVIALGAILTTFCSMPKCRNLMYVFCVITVIIVLLGFLITTVFAVMAPVLYMGCTVVNSGLASQTDFNTFTTNVGLTGNNITSLLSVCLSGGNGQILDALGVAGLSNLNSNLANMSTIMSGFTQYANFDTTGISTGTATVGTEIGYYVEAKRNDIFDTPAAIDYFQKLANGSYYPTCADAKYVADSLVPSTDTKSTSFVQCSKTNLITCTGSDTFASLATGCIDLASCFPNYDATPANIASDFSARYPTCPTVGSDMLNIYNNWDKVRRDTTTGIRAVKNKYDTDVRDQINNNMIPEINTLKTNCQSAITAVSGTSDKITNPNYGLIAGLNCKVIGENIVVAKDTVCVSFFNSIFFSLLTIGITSFAFLFALCCITCTGVRHFKQEQTKTKIGAAYGGGPDGYYEQTAVKLHNGAQQAAYP